MEKKTKKWVWPAITDLESAKFAARQGFYAAVFLAVISALIVIVMVDLWGLVDVVLYAVIALGIYKMYRIASIAGLTRSLLGIGSLWVVNLDVSILSYVIVILPFLVLVLMFINSVRGTFVHHKFVKEREK